VSRLQGVSSEAVLSFRSLLHLLLPLTTKELTGEGGVVDWRRGKDEIRYCNPVGIQERREGRKERRVKGQIAVRLSQPIQPIVDLGRAIAV
jgi:hypothetical protein